jgi:hypothetical protein
MSSDDLSNIDFPRTSPQDPRARPNPPEDLSEYGRQLREEPTVYGPDGSGETSDTEDESQIGRGAD